MEKVSWGGHGAMLGANVMWGLMSPLAKFVMVGGAVTPLVVTDMRIFGAMVLFWICSFFREPEHVWPRDMMKLLGASLLAIVFNQGCFIFGVGMTSPGDASIITTSMPLWAMVLAAIFLREPITGKKVLGIAAGAGGALLLILGSRPEGVASASGDYPFFRSIYMIKTETYNGLCTGFTIFVAGQRGQKIFEKTNISPARIEERVVNVSDDFK